MKNPIIILAFVLTMCQTEAQKIKSAEVPLSVKTSLEKSYSVARIQWEKEGANFEASFKKDGKEVSVVLDATGKILETETEIEKTDLPQAVLTALAGEYKDLKIEETARIDAEGVTTYEVELELGRATVELAFDSTGNLLKKTRKDRRRLGVTPESLQISTIDLSLKAG